MNKLATAVRSLLRYKPAIAWRPNTRLLREYVALSIYLYVCFAALLLFKAVILRGHAIVYAPYALALGKALLLAKFILIGRKLGIGWPFASSTLIHKIMYNSMVFLVFLAALSAIEHAIDAMVHHRTFSEVLGRTGWDTWGDNRDKLPPVACPDPVFCIWRDQYGADGPRQTIPSPSLPARWPSRPEFGQIRILAACRRSYQRDPNRRQQGCNRCSVGIPICRTNDDVKQSTAWREVTTWITSLNWNRFRTRRAICSWATCSIWTPATPSRA